MSSVFCIAEDRHSEETGIRLLLLSLREHCPGKPIFVFRPDPTTDFRHWLSAFPQVTLIPERPPGAETWNCKPQALLWLMDQGFDEIIWLDSDILLTRSPMNIFNSTTTQEIVLAEEMAVIPRQGSEGRTKGWGLSVGRTFPITMSSCVVKATPYHRPLLERWQELMQRPEYKAAQIVSTEERKFYLNGDQDILNALLGSTEFEKVPVRLLKRGRDLIHSGGYRTFSLRERMVGLVRPIATFLHNPASKPWIALDPSRSLISRFWFFRKLSLEVSPYVIYAKRYEKEMGQETSWMNHVSPWGLLLRFMGVGHYALRGLPLCLLVTCASQVWDLKAWSSEKPKPANPSLSGKIRL
jgi:hypothetical protein